MAYLTNQYISCVRSMSLHVAERMRYRDKLVGWEIFEKNKKQ